MFLLCINEIYYLFFSTGARSKSVNVSSKTKPTQDPNDAAIEADMEAAIYAQLELDLGEKAKILENLTAPKKTSIDLGTVLFLILCMNTSCTYSRY